MVLKNALRQLQREMRDDPHGHAKVTKSREGEGNKAEIVRLRLRLEESDTRCYHISDEAKALRFEIRANGEVQAELWRALEAELERRGIIEYEARTGE